MAERDEAEWNQEHEMAYNISMAALDDLPDYQSRALVALNIARQVIATQAAAVANLMPPPDAMPVIFAAMCRDFALNVFSLPQLIARENASACGHCPNCLANAELNERQDAARRECTN